MKVAFCFNLVLKLFLRRDLATFAAPTFCLTSFPPFCWLTVEQGDLTPLA